MDQQIALEAVLKLFELSGVPVSVRDKVQDKAVEYVADTLLRCVVLSHLTERHIEILRLLSEGYSSKEIGEQLYLSYRTVEVHRYNLIRLFKCRNMAQLIKKATDYKII
jgi:DNA-binding NarL/FixJ family response regulator